MKSIVHCLPNRTLTVAVVCCALLCCANAFCEERPEWQLVRSMDQTFAGPDVGDTWGQLLLMGIDFADARRGVVGGFNDATEIRHGGDSEGMLGYTEDGGRTFTMIKTKDHVWTVDYGSGSTFWATGTRRLLMRSDDAGKTWKQIGGGRGASRFLQIDFQDADHGLLATGSLTRIDDGKTVQRIETPAKGIRAVAMGDGGFGAAAGGDGELLITNDGGETWRYPDTWRDGDSNKVKNRFYNAAVAGDSRAWIVGADGIIVRTTDAGKTFDIKHIADGDRLHAVRFADATHGWVLASHNVYRTDDGGETWRLQPTAGGTNMNGLCIRDANTAWIAGHYGCVQHTTDGGNTWQTLNDYTDLYAVAMVSDNVGYAGAESGGIIKTEDGGKTWRFLPSLRGSAVEAIQFLDADTGWVVGDFGHIARTTDGGETWQRGSSGFRGILKDVHFLDAERGFAVGERGAILSTTDGGARWQAVASPTAEMLYAIDFPTPKTGYACGKGVVLKTSDGGATWTKLPSPTDLDILSDVRFTDESHGLMVGDIGAIFLTGDGGATWRKVASPVTHWLHRIEVVDENTFLVAGSRGTILRSVDGGKSWAAMSSGTRNNIYCISGRVAVGRWGQVQILDPGIDIKQPTLDTPSVAQANLLPASVWNPLPPGTAQGWCKIDGKGRLLEVTVNGRTYPTSAQFPTFMILTMKDGTPGEVKTIGPDDKAWTITPVDAEASRLPQNERAFIYDSDWLSARISYTALADRLVVRAEVLEEREGKLLQVSTGDAKFLRLMGTSPEVMRRGALVVPVDGGELIPFTGFSGDRRELQKSNHLHGWCFKNRMIGMTDGKAGVILKSHQWHAEFKYGQSYARRRPVPVTYLYLGWSFDTRVDSAENVAKAVKDATYGDVPPAWLVGPLPIATFGFDLQYVGDVNGDGDVNWVDAGITYRDGNYPRSSMMDQSPGMCDNFNQTQVSFNYGYILWSTPYLGNTHSDTRAHRRQRNGLPRYEWGDPSRSISYETQSGRMARYFDKQADEHNFAPGTNHIGADTWTCGAGGQDFSEDHPGTKEESVRAKIEVLRLLARRGYRTHSEALSEWGLAGNLLWGWWTPYFGGGAWLGGFSRCWQYSPKAHSGPAISHLFAKHIPLQAVIFQGMTYYGSGSKGPPGYAMLHGCRPNRWGVHGLREDAFYYYPWLVLWKTISPYRVTNIVRLEPDLWRMTYEDGSALEVDVRANTWVFEKDGITYDGYSPPNPATDPVRPRPAFTWGLPWNDYAKKFPAGSFGVWRNGTFTIKVPGIKAVKPPRVVGVRRKGGQASDAPPPAYTTKYKKGILTINIKDKNPTDHPMLIFEPVQPEDRPD